MDFRYKWLLQSIFSHLPSGEKINFFFQRFITKGLPINDNTFVSKVKTAYEHYLKNKKYCVSKNDKIYYEFGIGCDMVSPITMSLLGFNKIIAIDIKKLAIPKLVENTMEKFRRLKEKVPFQYKFPCDIDKLNYRNYPDILEEFFNIKYFAPADARNTGISTESIDFVSSTSVLEHIPQQDIKLILKECYRILKKSGVCSFLIDYRDHWSYFDKKITPYNFLRYSEKAWHFYNPSLQYQNRLRHRDYINLIKEANFEIVEVQNTDLTAEDIEYLREFPLNDFFRENYTIEELGIKSSLIVMRK